MPHNPRGRPRSKYPLSSVVNVRFEPAQREAVEVARMLTGESQSEFIRRAVLDTAQVVLVEADRVRSATSPAIGD